MKLRSECPIETRKQYSLSAKDITLSLKYFCYCSANVEDIQSFINRLLTDPSVVEIVSLETTINSQYKGVCTCEVLGRVSFLDT